MSSASVNRLVMVILGWCWDLWCWKGGLVRSGLLDGKKIGCCCGVEEEVKKWYGQSALK